MKLHLRRLEPDQQSSAGGQSTVSSQPQGSCPATLHLHHGLPPVYMHVLQQCTCMCCNSVHACVATVYCNGYVVTLYMHAHHNDHSECSLQHVCHITAIASCQDVCVDCSIGSLTTKQCCLHHTVRMSAVTYNI